MAEKRRWYGGMKQVGRPKYETDPPVPPAEAPKPKPVKKPKPLQKGTGEESVE